MKTVGDVYADACPCREILDLVGSKWSTLIIGLLEQNPHRFGDLRRGLSTVSKKVLTDTLRKLERSGLVSRTVLPTRPPQVEYALTDLGRSITAPLAAIRDWSEANLSDVLDAHGRFDAQTGDAAEASA